MVKISVCLEMIFTDLPYDRRIEEIAKSGFRTVEFWLHDATFDGASCPKGSGKDASLLREVCGREGVTISNMVVNSSDGSFGGSPVDASELSRYLDRLHEVTAFAKEIGVRKAITCSGNLVPGLSRNAMRGNLERAWGEAARIAESEGFMLVAEPLNTLIDHTGYYLDSSAEAGEIIRGINSPNLKLLYDIYHLQIMEGNILCNIERNMDIIGHFHAAGVPGRNELMTGELNYHEIIRRIDAAGYDGVFGLEYTPTIDSGSKSLAETRESLSEFME